ncbi:chromosome segregation protein [Corynebacterium faecale]|uniref:AAA family ATPase n=1 Tax=Corynebacterium faecale TaxID=1758466 RepID=UPI0025B2C1A8|nr:AAA family ATPase [Corynebacterium faecale]WJY91958.1 chromosome segregation protein [Corynebacterium faecale]
MRIHAITIDNFRAIDHLELRDIPDSGVIVIHGDNEKGKSSVLEAIQIVLTEKHTARNKVTKPVKPVDRDVPVRISLDVSVGPYRMVITKQFMKSPSSELQILEPRPDNRTGREADALLDDILESHLDRFLLNTLFMRQGEVEAGINAVGIPSLTSALDDQNGGGEGTEDTALMAAVEAEYAKFFTNTGRRVKSYEEFFTVVDELKVDLDQARAEIATLGAQVDRVSRLERERDTAGEKLPGALEELELRQEEYAAAVKVKAQAEDVATRLMRASTDHRHAVRQQEERAELRARAQKAATAVDEQSTTLAEAEAAAQVEESEITLRTQKLEEASARETAAIAEIKNARARVEHLTGETRRVELGNLLGSIDELHGQLKVLRARRAADTPVTAADIEALQKATENLKVHRALSQARGGHISFSSAGATEITVDGQPVTVEPDGPGVDLDREVTITIGEVTMVVNPGSDITRSRLELETAETELAELLDRLRVQDIDELRGRMAEQEKLATEIEALTRECDRLTGGGDIDALRAEFAALTDNRVDLDTDLTLTEAGAQLLAAETRRDEAGEEAKLIDAALDALRQRPAERAWTILRTRVEGLQDNAVATAADLARAVEDTTDEDLHEDVTLKLSELTVIEQEKREVDALLEQSDPVGAEQLLKGAQANVQSYRDTISTTTVELARLESHIQQAAGASERHAQAYAALEAAEHRLASEQRRANAAERLREVMIRHRESSRKRYAAPFAAKLARLAARVFGEETGFDLDDQLCISTRSIGSRTVNLDHLSGGAQEQLAILTRFAIADLVADSSTHGVVPVFIDDALGSTDPVRLTRISTLFGEAGRDSQVFVLTCVPERYNYVSPKIMHDIDSLKSVPV